MLLLFLAFLLDADVVTRVDNQLTLEGNVKIVSEQFVGSADRATYQDEKLDCYGKIDLETIEGDRHLNCNGELHLDKEERTVAIASPSQVHYRDGKAAIAADEMFIRYSTAMQPTKIDWTGHVLVEQGNKIATANTAYYSPDNECLTLKKVHVNENGNVMSANQVVFNLVDGTMKGVGNVRFTLDNVKGALQ